MTYEEYLNEIEDFDDITKQDLISDFQNLLPLDNPSIMQQMGYNGFQNFLKTENNAGVLQLGESFRGMNNVSPLLAMKFKNQKSKEISDKYFIDAFKDQYDDFDIIIDPGCTVNEEFLKQNFTKKTFNYFIDDDGKKGETSGDTKVNFIIFITKDENKIKEAYQCLKPSKNEIILFIEDNKGDNNGQLILAKTDESVKKVFKQVNQRTLNDYKPFHDMQGILKLDYKDWIALILNGRLEAKQLAVEDIIGSLLNVIKTFFLPSKALGWILNKIGDGIDYLKISDTIWDTQSDDYFFEKKNITSFFTIDNAPLAQLKKAIVNDQTKTEWNDLLPNFISDNAEIYIGKLENVIGNYNTYVTRQIEAIYSFQEQAEPIIDILNIKESIAFWVGMWNGLVDFVSSIFKFAGMILEAPFEIFDNFDKVVDGISQLFSSLSNIDISDELVKAYANIKKYLSEKDSGDVDWIRVAYISGFGLMFILTFFIPYANVAKLASIGKFGKLGVIIAEVLEGTGKVLGKVTQAVTREAKEIAKDIWKALTSLMEILKRGGAKLQEIFEKVSKAIIDWFLNNGDKFSKVKELLNLGISKNVIETLNKAGLSIRKKTSIVLGSTGGLPSNIFHVIHKDVSIFKGTAKEVAELAKKLENMSKEAAEKYLDDLLEKYLDDYINSQNFAFRKLGYIYNHTFNIAQDGTKEIYHYLIINGEKKVQGFSTISKDGVLFNVFEVTEQQKEISTAMYKLLDKIGFEKVEASYGSGSLGTNYKEFMKVYNISHDAEAAAFATPAGKGLNKALDNKFKPVDIVITTDNVKMYWIKK
nr:hypothetical protein [uncultured Chryseobacterium sp.]